MNKFAERTLDVLPEASAYTGLGGIVVGAAGALDDISHIMDQATPTWATVCEITGGTALGVALLGGLACGAVYTHRLITDRFGSR